MQGLGPHKYLEIYLKNDKAIKKKLGKFLYVTKLIE